MAERSETISAAALRELARTALMRAGVIESSADQIARVLVWADLSGHGSHGVSRVARYVSFIEMGSLDPSALPALDRDGGAVFRVNGNRCAGALALDLAVREAQARAARHGVAMGVVARTTHIGAAGYYAEQLAKAGMIALVGSAGTPLMAYHGTASKSVSTAPLAIGVPAAARPPLVLDMASSVAALGKIRQALMLGQAIPEGWALTETGEPTTDPALAAIQLPFAGPKGAGLALMLECLSSVLAGAPILTGALSGTGKGHRQNAFVIAMNVAAFRPLAEFTADVDALVAALKAQPPASGVTEILMPGENSARNRARNAEAGVRIAPKLLDALRALAGEGGE